VVEVAVLALAAVAVFLLQRRGLVASSAAVGIDPLLSAMPLLLAVAAGLLVLRVYPAPLRAVHRAVRASRAPVASVGSARAIREPAVGLVGTLALVTGIAIAVFGTVMISTVDHGLRQSARDQVGADLQIAAHDLPDTLVDQLTDLPGIDAAVALRSATGIEFSDEFGPTEVSILLADTVALHRVRPDIPALAGKVDGRLPILVSSDWADRIEGTELHVANSTATKQGVIAFNAVPGMTRHWILVDVSAADELGLAGEVPHRVLAKVVDGVASADVVADVTRVVVAEQPEQFAETVAVEDADSLLAQLRASPITSGLEVSLVIVSLASLLLTMLIVGLSSLTAAASRNRAVGVLRVLGMTPRQIRSLVAWEFAPVAASAVIAGVALGLGLPYLVTGVLDLRGFFGGNSPLLPALEPLWIVGAIVVFTASVIAAVAIATAAGRRLAPAGVLKMGEE
jgi:putative ABC transport system permease protein